MPNTLNQVGTDNFTQGAIVDQTLLLQVIRDGLGVYNTTVDPVVAQYSEDTIRQTLRVSQAPKTFVRDADGGNPENSKMVYRLLNVPLDDWALSSEFTIKWLQDALPSDVVNETEGALRGDVELQNTLFFRSIFLKQTVGAVGTAYQAGFWNGETDVPPYKNNAFSSAHFHYLGLNTTTLALSHIRDMKKDIQEHGYGLLPRSLHLWMSTTEGQALMALINASSGVLQAITGERVSALDAGIVGTGVMWEGIVLHVDDNVPVGYLAMIADDVKPIARRIHFNPAYQGLQIYGQGISEDYPLAGMKFLRRIGFAVQHMGAGTCRQLVESTTYTNPTFRLGN